MASARLRADFSSSARAGRYSEMLNWLSHVVGVKELQLLGDSEEAVQQAAQLLASKPKSLYARQLQGGDTLVHRLSRIGNLPMIKAALAGGKLAWAELSESKVPSWGMKLHAEFQGEEVEGGGVASSSVANIADGVGRRQQAIVRGLVNVKNSMNQTPLIMAARYNNPECISYLLEMGADPWLSDRCGGQTALHWACKEGHADCVAAILEKVPANSVNHKGLRYVDAQTTSGFTALHYAASSASADCARVLSDFNANLVASSFAESWGGPFVNFGLRTTPLHVAAKEGHPEVAREILRQYASLCVSASVSHAPTGPPLVDPRIKRDSHGMTPFLLHFKIARTRTRFAHLLNMLATENELLDFFNADEISCPSKGPPKLSLLACFAVKQKLVNDLQEIQKMNSGYGDSARNPSGNGELIRKPSGIIDLVRKSTGKVDLLSNPSGYGDLVRNSTGNRDLVRASSAQLPMRSRAESQALRDNACGICLTAEPNTQIVHYRNVGCNHVIAPIPGFKPYTHRMK
eukprot:gene15697-21808_t